MSEKDMKNHTSPTKRGLLRSGVLAKTCECNKRNGLQSSCGRCATPKIEAPSIKTNKTNENVIMVEYPPSRKHEVENSIQRQQRYFTPNCYQPGQQYPIKYSPKEYVEHSAIPMCCTKSSPHIVLHDGYDKLPDKRQNIHPQPNSEGDHINKQTTSQENKHIIHEENKNVDLRDHMQKEKIPPLEENSETHKSMEKLLSSSDRHHIENDRSCTERRLEAENDTPCQQSNVEVNHEQQNKQKEPVPCHPTDDISKPPHETHFNTLTIPRPHENEPCIASRKFLQHSCSAPKLVGHSTAVTDSTGNCCQHSCVPCFNYATPCFPYQEATLLYGYNPYHHHKPLSNERYIYTHSPPAHPSQSGDGYMHRILPRSELHNVDDSSALENHEPSSQTQTMHQKCDEVHHEPAMPLLKTFKQNPCHCYCNECIPHSVRRSGVGHQHNACIYHEPENLSFSNKQKLDHDHAPPGDMQSSEETSE